MAREEEIQALAEKYRAGGMGYGVAKEELFQVFEREVGPLRERYEDWMARPDDLISVLSNGARRARESGAQTISEVRNALGIGREL